MDITEQTLLLRLSHDALTGIMNYMDWPSTLNLCRTNPTVASIISACTLNISIEAMRHDHYVRYVSKGLMPLMKQGMFGNLRHLHIKIDSRATGVGEGCILLSDLPTSLTSLSLDHVIIEVRRPEDAKTYRNLAGLQYLSLKGLRYSKYMPKTGFKVLPWLKRVISNVTHLTELVCIPSTALSSRDVERAASIIIPSTLESLTVHPAILLELTPHHWPPHLTSLSVSCFENGSRLLFKPKRPLQIPATVTRLSLCDELGVVCSMSPKRTWQVMENMCLTNPSQLRQLTVDWKSHPTSDIMEAISKCQCLEELTITPYFTQDVDFSLIPRCVKKIALAGQVLASQWHQLPPNATYLNALNDNASVFQIHLNHDMTYLPRQLTRVSVYSRPLPIHLPILQHVSFVRIEAPSREVCDQYMTNLSRTLQSMDVIVSLTSTVDVFWLHHDVGRSLPFESRFPLLTKLRMMTELFASELTLNAWINHLPRTITDLTITVGYKDPPGSSHALNLHQSVLPPFLEHLFLQCRRSDFTCPASVPITLQSMRLSANSLVNPSELYLAIHGQIGNDKFSATVGGKHVAMKDLIHI